MRSPKVMRVGTGNKKFSYMALSEKKHQVLIPPKMRSRNGIQPNRFEH